jgi:hypothetical protein
MASGERAMSSRRLLPSHTLSVYVSPVPIRSSLRCVAVALVLGCGGNAAPTPTTPAGPTPPPQEAILPFASVAFAGQNIAVAPMTLVVAADTLGREPPLAEHAQALAWADSVVGAILTERGPEVKWVLPPELRRIARRSPTVAPDPDRMGQSLLRAKGIKQLSDPLRGDLRSLAALTNGRFVMVPAALSFVPDSKAPIRAELVLVLVDARTGRVFWRTVTWGVGGSPAEALSRALDLVFPV